MGWWAIFRREMILLKQRASRLGYVFASVFYPLIYLFAFGLGLGKVVQVEGGYGAFLCAGMAGISVMTNSFQQTSIAISVGRIYYKTFQSLMVSPVPPGQVAVGLMLAGMVRGMVAAMIVYTIGAFFFGGWQLTWVGFAGLLLGSAIFAALGSIAGMIVEGNDGLSVIQNFFMTPMIFFSGSFFPIKNLPWGIDQVVRLLPLGMINQLLHARTFGMEQVYFLIGLSIMAVVCWGWGTHVIRNYQE